MQQGPFAPQALPRFNATTSPAATVSPSADFSMGRGRRLQLLSMPLSPCRPCYPAGAARRFSQIATYRTAFAHRQEARPPDFYLLTRLPRGLLALRPGDSLTIPKMALSAGFTRFVSSTGATQATTLLTLAPVGLTPTEHASLRLTHCLSEIFSEMRSRIETASCIKSLHDHNPFAGEVPRR